VTDAVHTRILFHFNIVLLTEQDVLDKDYIYKITGTHK